MNVNALDVLMRAFRRGEGTALGSSPAAPVAAVTRSPRVADALESDTTPAALTRRLAEDVTGGAGAPRTRMALFPADPEILDTSSRSEARQVSPGTTVVAGRAARDAANPGAASATSSAALRGTELGNLMNADADRVARATVGSPRISPAAQLVSELMQAAASASRAQTIRPTTALLDGAAMEVEGLASALQRSIVHSGLFYESHLADWALQRCTRDDLEREPQAGWIAQSTAAAGDAVTDASDGASRQAAAVSAASAIVLPHVRLQLETLETGRLCWQGELWPRQDATITIDADAKAPDWADPSPDTRWRTKLALTLPSLGRVEVELRLAGTSIGVVVRPREAAAATALLQAQDELAAALAGRFEHQAVRIEHATTS